MQVIIRMQGLGVGREVGRCGECVEGGHEGGGWGGGGERGNGEGETGRGQWGVGGGQ